MKPQLKQPQCSGSRDLPWYYWRDRLLGFSDLLTCCFSRYYKNFLDQWSCLSCLSPEKVYVYRVTLVATFCATCPCPFICHSLLHQQWAPDSREAWVLAGQHLIYGLIFLNDLSQTASLSCSLRKCELRYTARTRLWLVKIKNERKHRRMPYFDSG